MSLSVRSAPCSGLGSAAKAGAASRGECQPPSAAAPPRALPPVRAARNRAVSLGNAPWMGDSTPFLIFRSSSPQRMAELTHSTCSRFFLSTYRGPGRRPSKEDRAILGSRNRPCRYQAAGCPKRFDTLPVSSKLPVEVIRIGRRQLPHHVVVAGHDADRAGIRDQLLQQGRRLFFKQAKACFVAPCGDVAAHRDGGVHYRQNRFAESRSDYRGPSCERREGRIPCCRPDSLSRATQSAGPEGAESKASTVSPIFSDCRGTGKRFVGHK